MTLPLFSSGQPAPAGDLGTTQAAEDVAHEVYGGMLAAAIAFICALIVLAGVVAWLVWRYIL